MRSLACGIDSCRHLSRAMQRASLLTFCPMKTISCRRSPMGPSSMKSFSTSSSCIASSPSLRQQPHSFSNEGSMHALLGAALWRGFSRGAWGFIFSAQYVQKRLPRIGCKLWPGSAKGPQDGISSTRAYLGRTHVDIGPCLFWESRKPWRSGAQAQDGPSLAPISPNIVPACQPQEALAAQHLKA